MTIYPHLKNYTIHLFVFYNGRIESSIFQSIEGYNSSAFSPNYFLIWKAYTYRPAVQGLSARCAQCAGSDGLHANEKRRPAKGGVA
ncbi:hypothetical protein ACUSIJ_02880 [Pseudochelatococcus sp. B33]